jgi:hypothetical protein
LRGHREGAGRQVDEPVIAGAIGDRHARTEEYVAGGGNRHAWQCAALAVTNASTQAALSTLGQYRARCHDARHDKQRPNHHVHASAPCPPSKTGLCAMTLGLHRLAGVYSAALSALTGGDRIPDRRSRIPILDRRPS